MSSGFESPAPRSRWTRSVHLRAISLSQVSAKRSRFVRSFTTRAKQAAAQGIVIVAVPWSKPPGALAGLDLAGKIVVDANNPIEAPLFKPAELGGRVSSAVFADLVPGAKVVKAFNHLPPPVLSADPQENGGQRVLFFSGDDAEAKAEVAWVIDRLGFFGIDLGDLATGGRLVQFLGGPLSALNLVKLGL